MYTNIIYIKKYTWHKCKYLYRYIIAIEYNTTTTTPNIINITEPISIKATQNRS